MPATETLTGKRRGTASGNTPPNGAKKVASKRAAASGGTSTASKSSSATTRRAGGRNGTGNGSTAATDGAVDQAFLNDLLSAIRQARGGDFTVRLRARRGGLAGDIGSAFNELIEMNARSNRELARVARQVGRDGRMTERMDLPDASGAWRESVGSVNDLISDLSRPTTEVARVIESVAKGDLSQKVALTIEGQPVRGEFLRIGTAVNSMVDQLSSFSAEVSRVAREVGTEGKLGGQAKVKGVSGTWKDLTDNVNSMASNLTNQVRNIAEVTTAVAKGDLSRKITVDVKGEILELKDTINTMVDQLSSFADEVTRVAREVGTEGILGGQAHVRGVSGTWKDLTDNVNYMASNLTSQVRNIAQVATAVANGDLGKKITVEAKGEVAALADTINSMTDTLRAFADEVTRVAREVGTEGILGGQAEVKGVAGTWKDLTDNVNSMASNLTNQVRDIAQVATAVARGNLGQKITVQARGEVAALADTINSMTDTLRAFADEVTRVAREVGTEGKLGGQAQVEGVAGTWKDLTDNVNYMASNLTGQVRDIAQVTTAVATGDLTKKITADARGEILELKSTINTMVDQLSAFADEVTRVAREVGTEGILGGQAHVRGVSGTWKDLTDNVNYMASNLTGQVRNIAQVATAVAKGDLTKKITVDAKGEVAGLADTINSMTDTLLAFADEVTRVAREVGTEGKLGGQAQVRGVAGTWKDLTDSVNYMASNLTGQVRDIAQVATAVATGDLTKKITVDVRGEILELKSTINTMVDQLSAFADEVTRVAREVGTEGKLGGQAQVEGVSGTWKDLTDNVNYMASNLTSQVRNIAQVTTAVANGDLTQKITVDVEGEILELKNTINTMVDQLSSFADEVTRVAREVGTEGKLGGQARVEGVSGTWRDLTDNVNYMASNLTTQVRNIAQVTTAVARGDLTQKITVEAKGEVAVLADTINSMTDTLGAFANEVTRVAREVGTEGILGGQAQVEGVAGTWKDLTDSVNYMASNLTGQVRNIAQVATAVANGDLTQKITVDVRGEILQLKDTINTMVDQLSSFADEVTRVAREVGTEGILGGQARVRGVSGTWRDLTDSVNYMASNLTGQVRNIAQVTTAVANGDLTQKITVDVQGEILQLKNTINTMVDQLSSFADEVTRVAREVGTEGNLGGHARVRGVSGTWRDLTDSVNSMADSLTAQVRDIAQVTTAVANGDLTKKITVDVRGEILELKNTINTMVDQLSSFAAEVTRVAREVGTEGKLGGQAEVRGVSGTWEGLTDNVNIMASSLTTQVRAIAEVATAVTQGDLSRSITVEAQGEVAELKDNINQMISNLAETTQVNEEQDWLKTNLARISGLMQGQRDLKTVSRLLMNELTPTVSAQHGAFFLNESDESEEATLHLIASYGYKARKNVPNKFKVGEAIVGQAALERSRILITEAPNDYIKISSGLGEADPVNIVVLPILFEDQILGVIELATLRAFSEVHLSFLDQVIETIGVVLNTIIATMRTEELLEQSQRLTGELTAQSAELQTQQEELRLSNAELESQAASLKASEELLQQQQEELQQTNEELQEKARLLAEQNAAIEVKNREIEMARIGLEEKAQQLALSSKYKSEFLANMSHELRTPLNSLLILAKLLSQNEQGNLDERQVEFAQTIHNAGSDLLDLINDILDLSKVEAGKMDVVAATVPLSGVADRIRQSFGPLAADKKLTLEVQVSEDAGESIVTDEQRLHQVLKNLMSNAVKFTEQGSVRLEISRAPEGIRFTNPALASAHSVVAFTVTDTGVGIPPDKLRLVFEAFQQADGTTSRRYGGTGLGLSISREIARLLGGEIRVESTLAEGSVFTLYLPDTYTVVEETATGTETAGAATAGTSAGTGTSAQRPAQPIPVDPDHLTPMVGDVPDDRATITHGDRIMLVVSSEADLTTTATELSRRAGFKVISTPRAGTAVSLAREYRPDTIILDTELHYAEGSALLVHFKQDPDLRHIPVHVLSAPDRRHDTLSLGAFGFTPLPLEPGALDKAVADLSAFSDRPTRYVLVVEDDENELQAVSALLGAADGVEVKTAQAADEAEQVLAAGPVDCIVLDLKLPRSSGFTLLEKLQGDEHLSRIPVIIYTGKDLTRREETRLSKYAESIIVKDARSPERLLAETTLFLHQPPSRLPHDQRLMLEHLHTGTETLQGKRVLVVDDDVRNVFALTSVLERHGMQVTFAENGREGLAALKEDPKTDIVLMDIMMPEMDGYETMAAIRKIPAFRKLPIIALTAKAMKGDREKSIEAGASDYITKPVDVEQLISLMRVWLYR
ncbi:MAG TPA: HAMP domain-containing protein [Acidimicrobiales bacterium]|nr:HAMP domain-containing protein [Acidimicrobiales bacterium]